MSKEYKGNNNTVDLRNKFYQRADYFSTALRTDDNEALSSVTDFNSFEYVYYGKTDYQLNSIWLDESNISYFDEGAGLDIAVAAFKKMRQDYYKALVDNSDNFDLNDPFLSRLVCFNSYSSPSVAYEQHVNEIFTTFRQEIETNRLFSSISDFSSFVKHFLLFFSRIGKNFPLTKVGWQKSNKSSIFKTGLAFSVTNYECGDDQQKSLFFNSRNFHLFKESAETHGFNLHFQCPWILIFNPNMQSYVLKNSDGNGLLKDFEIYNPDLIFEKKYIYLYKQDIYNIKHYIIKFYNLFTNFYPFYKINKITKDNKIKRNVKRRPPIDTDTFNNHFTESQLFEMYIDIRNIEEDRFYPPPDLARLKQKAIFFKKKLDKDTSIRYINEQFIFSYSQKEGGINKVLNKQKKKNEYFDKNENPHISED